MVRVTLTVDMPSPNLMATGYFSSLKTRRGIRILPANIVATQLFKSAGCHY
ncbi:MAG: hypothetical protein KHF84_00255 [Thermoplasmata archaeon]|nr:hypothetical protein [Candidatus Sysuiplasma jiujiangense]